MYMSVFLTCLERSEDQEECLQIGGDLMGFEGSTLETVWITHEKGAEPMLEELVHYKLIRTGQGQVRKQNKLKQAVLLTYKCPEYLLSCHKSR